MDDLRKQITFDTYKYIGISVVLIVLALLILFLLYKGYRTTKNCPCEGACSCFGSCGRKKKKKNGRDGQQHLQQSENGHCNGGLNHDYHAGFDETWVSDMNVDMGHFNAPDHECSDGRRKKGSLCMRFCLSEPVQDCCEFLDCDLMWRKKNIYSYPYFGRRKGQQPSHQTSSSTNTHSDDNGGALNNAYNLQNLGSSAPPPTSDDHLTTLERRPTRPAPPPPKLPGAPGSSKHNIPIFDDGTLINDNIECDPIPEAPPSPEPVRTRQPDQPRSIYVDPLHFLQKPFLRLSIALSGKDKTDGKEDEEPEALYSKVKDFVMSKVKKAGSVSSLNKVGGAVSSHPDGEDRKGRNSNGRTASMASLHHISESQLERSYSDKRRSASLASLTMIDNSMPNGQSRHNSKSNLDEDVPPNQRDEYIDLEEMARKMAARMQQSSSKDQLNGPHPSEVITSQPLSAQNLQQMSGGKVVDTSVSPPQTSPVNSTPDFIPASAYGTVSKPSQPAPSYEIGPSVLYPNSVASNVPSTSTTFTHPNFESFQSPKVVGSSSQCSPIAPSTPSPSVGNNTIVPYMGPHSVTATPNGTLGRLKPTVPPRPSAIADNPNYRSLNRPVVAPPSPKFADGKRPVATVISSPNSPGLVPGRPTIAPPMPPLSVHEQQLLQQQLLHQQLYQQQLLNPAMQQLLLQQQLQQEHHQILTPAVQQQLIQEQMYQHMLQQQQQYHIQQQLQQQLYQQQYGGSTRYRQPLSSTSSTGSTVSSKSSRSAAINRPNHAPPPPPTSSQNNSNHPVIESSI